MMRSIRASLFAALALVSAAAVAFASPVPYKIDPVHSEVGFKVRHFFTKVPGRFNDFEGTILLDDKDLTASTVDVTIQTASIYTNNERRDKHLRSEDFFFAEKFPTITFKSTKVVLGEGQKFKIDGDLTMRGVTKPVTLDAELVGMGTVGMMGSRAGFEATTQVNRKDWGINWNKVLDNGGTMLDDNVAIELGVEAFKEEPKQGDAKPGAAAPTAPDKAGAGKK